MKGSNDAPSIRLLEEVEEAILVFLEYPESVECPLQFESLRPILRHDREEILHLPSFFVVGTGRSRYRLRLRFFVRFFLLEYAARNASVLLLQLRQDLAEALLDSARLFREFGQVKIEPRECRERLEDGVGRFREGELREHLRHFSE